jgi:hypothetical protein
MIYNNFPKNVMAALWIKSGLEPVWVWGRAAPSQDLNPVGFKYPQSTAASIYQQKRGHSIVGESSNLSRATETTTLANMLGLMENVGRLLLLSSSPVVSSSCPCLFRIKTEAHTLIF